MRQLTIIVIIIIMLIIISQRFINKYLNTQPGYASEQASGAEELQTQWGMDRSGASWGDASHVSSGLCGGYTIQHFIVCLLSARASVRALGLL